MSDLITLEAFDADGAIQETAEAAGATRADFLKRGGVAGAASAGAGAAAGRFGRFSPLPAGSVTPPRPRRVSTMGGRATGGPAGARPPGTGGFAPAGLWSG